jgi:hypothetical protein
MIRVGSESLPGPLRDAGIGSVLLSTRSSLDERPRLSARFERMISLCTNRCSDRLPCGTEASSSLGALRCSTYPAGSPTGSSRAS